MKKILATLLCAALCGTAVVGFSACAEEPTPDDLNVYAPDGAPALALAYAIAQEEAKEEDTFDFDVVDANNIQTYVTGEDPQADLAVLPVNAAAKLLGKGTVYQMLGTVTNGNLYFLTTGDNEPLTKDGMKASLLGKRLGVMQLNNVPGLTLQVVLAQNGVEYQIAQSVSEETASDKVTLVPFQQATDITPASKCDYYLCPEPAATAKIKGTKGTPNPFKDGGSLQTLYGGEGGYPQAAVVAKKSVISSRPEDVKTFLGYLGSAATYLQSESTDISTILQLLDDVREDGLTPSFSAANLTKEVIARCSVGFTASKNCKDSVNAFLQKLIGVNPNATSVPDDAFFYMG